ncbi:MAG: hypothetical protein ACRELY_33105 [Polyangiaceae bacterium]
MRTSLALLTGVLTSVGAAAACSSQPISGAESEETERVGPSPVISIATTQPIGLAADETTIYWRTGAGDLMSASVAGRDVSTRLAGASDAGGSALLIDSERNDLLVDGASAYFIVNAGSSSYVQAARLDDSGASTLDVTTHVTSWAQAMALDATSLYVVRYDIDEQGGTCPDLGIDVVPLGQGATTTLHGPCSLVRMTVDSAANVYWTDRGRPPGNVNPSVMMQSVSSTLPTEIASAVSPYGIAVYGGNVYWSDAGNIMLLPVGATNASVLSSSAEPRDIVVDASGVYWIDSGSAIMTAPLGGGAATAIAQGTNVVALATNGTSVFWADEGTPADDYADGTVMGVAK